MNDIMKLLVSRSRVRRYFKFSSAFATSQENWSSTLMKAFESSFFFFVFFLIYKASKFLYDEKSVKFSIAQKWRQLKEMRSPPSNSYSDAVALGGGETFPPS